MEQRGVPGPGVGRGRRHQLGFDLECDGRTYAGGVRPAWPVERQRERPWKCCERTVPERVLTGDTRVGLIEQGRSPHRVVGVVDGQRLGPIEFGGIRRGRAESGAFGATLFAGGKIAGDEVGEQQPDRPAVGDDVVHHDHHDMPVRRFGDHVNPQRDRAAEVESAGGDVGEKFNHLTVCEYTGRGRCHLDGQSDIGSGKRVVGSEDQLVRHTAGDRVDRAQAFVPIEQVSQRNGERRLVEVPVDP